LLPLEGNENHHTTRRGKMQVFFAVFIFLFAAGLQTNA